MAQKTLGSGSASLVVSAQGFGCMGITAFYGKPTSDDDAVQLMQHAFNKGITFFDTAESYICKVGDAIIYNEVVVGKAIKQIGRSRVQIATKYMPTGHSSTEMTERMLLEACQASCERLGVKYVDLYYVHRPHPTVPIAEQAAAMLAVVKRGFCRFVGLSEFSPQNIKLFHQVCPVTCVQQEWSLMNRDLEEELVPTCRELGIGIVAYAPLCRALLGGHVRSAADLKEGDLRSKRYSRFAAGNLEQNAVVVGKVVDLAQSRGVTAAQLSLAWVANQGVDVVPIPGTTSIGHLDDNIRSQDVHLTEEELSLIAAAVPQESVAGDRFAGGATVSTFRSSAQPANAASL
jgi:aryl-alcohol dehydrogenase-like predicted oxidoreductase